MKQYILTLMLMFLPDFTFSQMADERGYLVKMGNTAPDFSMKLTDGKTTIDILSLTGQVVCRAFEGNLEKGEQQTIQFDQPLAEGM